MAGLVPAIHVLAAVRKTWMPGPRPAMTVITVIQRNRNTPKCPKIADASGFCSFNHLVGKGNQRRRHRDTDHLCRAQVDDEIEFDRRLHGEIGRLLTLEDAIDKGSCLLTEDTRTLFLSQLEGRDPENLAVWQDGWRTVVHARAAEDLTQAVPARERHGLRIVFRHIEKNGLARRDVS